MPIPYFDIPKNNAGTLASRLSVDCKVINKLTSSIIGINIMNVSSLICGMVIAFIGSWQLTLITLALSTIVFISGAL
jgi:ATP-binding cassette subfamily B (MDR/TAP) protein 1